MFLVLNHQSLDVYIVVKSLVKECYRISSTFPPEERFAISAQLKRAALSVHLNLSEGCSRKSAKERKRFFEVSRGSLIEVDAAFEIAEDKGYFNRGSSSTIEELMKRSFLLLTALIKS